MTSTPKNTITIPFQIGPYICPQGCRIEPLITPGDDPHHVAAGECEHLKVLVSYSKPATGTPVLLFAGLDTDGVVKLFVVNHDKPRTIDQRLWLQITTALHLAPSQMVGVSIEGVSQ